MFGFSNIRNALALFPASEQNTQINTAPIEGLQEQDVQILEMTQSASGYRPDVLKVKAGIPVRWIITSESSFTCASTIAVPSLNIQKNLQKGQNIIEFTPTQKGSIPFSCSMGMYRGTILVE